MYEVRYAEPMTAVKKPFGLPKGMSPQPAPMPAGQMVPNAPVNAPSPGSTARKYGQGFNPNATGPQQVQRRGGGYGHYGSESPLSGEPRPREIPRSKWQRPEQYQGDMSRWSRRTSDGRKGMWKNVRIPTTAPAPVAKTAGSLGRKLLKVGPFVEVGFELLFPPGTSPGGIPDFSMPLPDPDMQPEPGDQTDICGKGGTNARNGGSRPGAPGRVVQYRRTEFTSRNNTALTNITGGVEWSRPLGIRKKHYSSSSSRDYIDDRGTIKNYYGLSGKRTYTEYENGQPVEYVEYSYWHQWTGKPVGSDKKWLGQIGEWVDWPVKKSLDTGPSLYGGYGEGHWKKLPSQLSSVIDCVEQYEPDDEPDEYDDPNDYKREEDDRVACKWLTENNVDVDQLTIEEFTYKKFKGCDYKQDGSPDFFNEGKIMSPRGIGPSIVAMLNSQADLLGSMCELPVPPFALPDWMPTKWANMNKLVVLYAEQKDTGGFHPAKYSVTIPHWSKSRSQTSESFFTSYTKGQYQCIYEMSDGARITINANTASAARAVMGLIVGGLPSNLTEDIPVPAAGLRGGKTLKQIDVFPRECRYFEKGKEDLIPKWIKKFS